MSPAGFSGVHKSSVLFSLLLQTWELHFPEFVSIVVLAAGKNIIRLTSDYQRYCPYGFKNLSVIPNREQTSSLLGKY